MSLDIFVCAPFEGDQEKFDRSIVERAFEGLVFDRDDNLWYLCMADGEKTWGTLLIDPDDQIDGFSINRPPFVPEFWNAIYEVLRQTRTMLCWPGSADPHCCIAQVSADAEFLARVEDMLGPPAIVTCGAEIEVAINS